MPQYCFCCEGCGRKFEQFGRMSDPPLEAACDCGQVAYRDLVAENVQAGVEFRPFDSKAMGCPRWEAQRAYRREDGAWVRKRPDGTEKVLCPPMAQFNPKKGAIRVESRSQLKELHRQGGYVPNQ